MGVAYLSCYPDKGSARLSSLGFGIQHQGPQMSKTEGHFVFTISRLTSGPTTPSTGTGMLRHTDAKTNTSSQKQWDPGTVPASLEDPVEPPPWENCVPVDQESGHLFRKWNNFSWSQGICHSTGFLEAELEKGMGLICGGQLFRRLREGGLRKKGWSWKGCDGRGSLAPLIQGVQWGCWTGLCKVVLPRCQGLCFCSLCQMGAPGSGEGRGEERRDSTPRLDSGHSGAWRRGAGVSCWQPTLPAASLQM